MTSTGKTLLTAALVLAGCIAREAPAPSVRIATTTSLENSGLLEQLRSAFLADAGIEIEAHVVGSGKAFDLARDGIVELAITHEPEGEAELLRTGQVDEQTAFMANAFILVGPPANPARIPPGLPLIDAMRRLHQTGATFLSRGDESGTHVRERDLWTSAGVDPGQSSGYRSMGQGMSALLRSASEMQGYALTDETTFVAMKPVLRLQEFARGGIGSANIYRVSLMRGRGLQPSREARTFYDWLVSERGQSVIEAFGRSTRSGLVPLAKRENGQRISYDGASSAAGEMGNSEVESSHQAGPGSEPIPVWQKPAE